MKINDSNSIRLTKKSQVISFVNEGKYKEALSICKSWNLPISGEESDTLRRAYECMINPRFYTELGYIPEDQIEEAITILNRIYKKSDILE